MNYENKVCNFCGESISEYFKRCPYCGSLFEGNNKDSEQDKQNNEEENQNGKLLYNNFKKSSDINHKNDPVNKPPGLNNSSSDSNMQRNIKIDNDAENIKNDPLRKTQQKVGYSSSENSRVNSTSPNENITGMGNGAKVLLTVLTSVIPGIGQIIGAIMGMVFISSNENKDKSSFGTSIIVSSIIMFIVWSLVFGVIIIANY